MEKHLHCGVRKRQIVKIAHVTDVEVGRRILGPQYGKTVLVLITRERATVLAMNSAVLRANAAWNEL